MVLAYTLHLTARQWGGGRRIRVGVALDSAIIPPGLAELLRALEGAPDASERAG